MSVRSGRIGFESLGMWPSVYSMCIHARRLYVNVFLVWISVCSCLCVRVCGMTSQGTAVSSMTVPSVWAQPASAFRHTQGQVSFKVSIESFHF